MKLLLKDKKKDFQDENTIDEQFIAIEEKIENVSFSGIIIQQIVVASFFIGCFLIPILALLFIFPLIQTELEKPLEFLQMLESSHFLIYGISSFACRYVMENFSFNIPTIDLIKLSEHIAPDSLGSSYDNKEELFF
jgi:hypothetical protein